MSAVDDGEGVGIECLALDRGPGIPARQVKTVFEPFHRLEDSLSSGIPGSGLGLTLARRMARVLSAIGESLSHRSPNSPKFFASLIRRFARCFS